MAKMQNVMVSGGVARATGFPLIFWNWFNLFDFIITRVTLKVDQNVQIILQHVLQCRLFSPQLTFKQQNSKTAKGHVTVNLKWRTIFRKNII